MRFLEFGQAPPGIPGRGFFFPFDKSKTGESRGRKATGLKHCCYDGRAAEKGGLQK
jgi:hypothetical protein